MKFNSQRKQKKNYLSNYIMTDNSTTTTSMTDTDTATMFQEKTQQDLNNISQLQQQEKELYTQLDDVSLTSQQREQIITKINEISQIRMNLYLGLKDTYTFYKDNISASTETLRQSILATDVLENELNRTKKRMNLIEDKTYNNLRLVEINTYFGKRYNAHANLMKTIVYICIPVIILALLYNNDVLPGSIYSVLVVIVIVIGMFLIGSQIIDMSNRDDMNWDEYDWNFNKQLAPSAKSVITDPNKQQDPWETPNIGGGGNNSSSGSCSSGSGSGILCVGSACCYEGSTYDTTKNVCVPNTMMYSSAVKMGSNIPDTYNTNFNTMDTNTNTKNESNLNEGFHGLDKYAYAEMKPISVNTNILPTFAKITKF